MIVLPTPPEPERPQKPEPIDDALSVGMPKSVKAAVRAAASDAGQSMSAWVLDAIRAKLRSL